jgi:hypothetical protein
MRTPEHPLLPFLVDLESSYDPSAVSDYDPQDLIRYALGLSDYWAGLALGWLDEGAPSDYLGSALLELEGQRSRPQSLRHSARRLRKAL